jgi:hypothetical protein
MAKTLDVYRDWLGVQETARPLNFYQLLRLKRFEDNTAKIREHYRKIAAHLRKFDSGETAPQAQELHAELSKALLCLTDARRKQAYDSSLGRKTEGEIKRRSLEEILSAQGAISAEQLAKGQKFAQAAGMELRDALIQIKAAPPDAIMSAYAESVGVPYVDTADVKVDESLVAQVPAVIARQHSCAPMMVDDNQLFMVSPHLIDPNVEEELRLRVGMPIRSVLCTPAGINELINKYYPREKAAAEVAAGGTKQSGKTVGAAKADAKSGTQPAVAAAPAADTPAVPPVDKTSPEYIKKRRDYTIVAFNFTCVAYEFIYIGSGYFDWTWLGFFFGFFVAAGVAFYTWTKMK